MPRKLPSYFCTADRDNPCPQCDKIKKTCRYCQKCYDCCECEPKFICPHCHRADILIPKESQMAQELGYCECEPCATCGINIEFRDDGNYLPGNYQPYCDKCFPEKT